MADPPFSVQLAEPNGLPREVDAEETAAPPGRDDEAAHVVLCWHEGNEQLYDWEPLEHPELHESARNEEQRKQQGPQTHTLDECIDVRFSCLPWLVCQPVLCPLGPLQQPELHESARSKEQRKQQGPQTHMLDEFPDMRFLPCLCLAVSQCSARCAIGAPGTPSCTRAHAARSSASSRAPRLTRWTSASMCAALPVASALQGLPLLCLPRAALC